MLLLPFLSVQNKIVSPLCQEISCRAALAFDSRNDATTTVRYSTLLFIAQRRISPTGRCTIRAGPRSRRTRTGTGVSGLRKRSIRRSTGAIPAAGAVSTVPTVSAVSAGTAANGSLQQRQVQLPARSAPIGPTCTSACSSAGHPTSVPNLPSLRWRSRLGLGKHIDTTYNVARTAPSS